jgi:mannitol operon repressor
MTKKDLKYFSEFLQEFQKETDRGAALVGAALLDSRMQRLVLSHFSDKRIAEGLLSGGNAPLGSLGVRLKLAFSLGLITQLEYKECDTIRKIRNEFAHQVHGLTFSDPRLAGLASNLRANTPSGERFNGDPRQLFINSVIMVSLSLWYRPEYAAKFRAESREWKYQLEPDAPTVAQQSRRTEPRAEVAVPKRTRR